MSTINKIKIKAEMSARRTLASILSEYNVNRSDVEIDGQYATIFVSSNRNERITPPTNGDLWVLETDNGTFTTNDKDGKFFRFAMVNEEGTRFLNKEELYDYFNERALRAEREANAVIKTVTSLLDSAEVCPANYKLAIDMLDDLKKSISDDTSFFLIDYVEPRVLFKTMIIHADITETRSLQDIMQQYQCVPEQCREQNNYVEITLRDVYTLPKTGDLWVAQRAEDTWVTNDRNHTVYKYEVWDEYGQSFINQKDLLDQLAAMIENEECPLDLEEIKGDLCKELSREHPDMDVILDTVNEFGDDLFGGISISEIPVFA